MSKFKRIVDAIGDRNNRFAAAERAAKEIEERHRDFQEQLHRTCCEVIRPVVATLVATICDADPMFAFTKTDAPGVAWTMRTTLATCAVFYDMNPDGLSVALVAKLGNRELSRETIELPRTREVAEAQLEAAVLRVFEAEREEAPERGRVDRV